jgi:hypothetical protein
MPGAPNVPRWMAWRSIRENHTSTMFSQEPEVWVKCIVICGLRASQAWTVG